MIVFVGDKPSKKNIDPKIAFVGTKSYKTLLNWIADMDIDIRQVELQNASTLTHVWSCHDYKYIALGKIALRKIGELGYPNVLVYELPHPSGLNRKINDKKWLQQELKKCKAWINENSMR